MSNEANKTVHGRCSVETFETNAFVTREQRGTENKSREKSITTKFCCFPFRADLLSERSIMMTISRANQMQND